MDPSATSSQIGTKLIYQQSIKCLVICLKSRQIGSKPAPASSAVVQSIDTIFYILNKLEEIGEYNDPRKQHKRDDRTRDTNQTNGSVVEWNRSGS